MTVGVFAHFGGEVVAKVFDDRVDGFEQSVELYHRKYDDESGSPIAKDRREAETVATVCDQVIDWLREHDAAVWEHPEVCEAVFEVQTVERPPMKFTNRITATRSLRWASGSRLRRWRGRWLSAG